MARTALLILAFGLLAAVNAVTVSQQHDINSITADCVYEVPKISDFEKPSDTCRWEGIGAVIDVAANKQTFISVVKACLNKFGVKSPIVTSVEKCLNSSLNGTLFI